MINLEPSTANDWVLLVFAILTAVVGVGRLTRVVTYDSYPPAAKMRAWWDRITHDGPWSKLAHCHWCMAPWLMVVCVGWFFLGFLAAWIIVVWWIFWGTLAVSYLSSILVEWDSHE